MKDVANEVQHDNLKSVERLGEKAAISQTAARQGLLDTRLQKGKSRMPKRTTSRSKRSLKEEDISLKESPSEGDIVSLSQNHQERSNTKTGRQIEVEKAGVFNSSKITTQERPLGFSQTISNRQLPISDLKEIKSLFMKDYHGLNATIANVKKVLHQDDNIKFNKTERISNLLKIYQDNREGLLEIRSRNDSL